MGTHNRTDPKTPEGRGPIGIKTIGITLPPARHLALDEDIKKAAELKNHYGDLGIPFILVVNVTDEFHVDKIDVMNALFGQETVSFTGKEAVLGPRRPNKAWHTPYGARNTKISAVMIFGDLAAHNAGNREPWIVHNPHAQCPLSVRFVAAELICTRSGEPDDAGAER